MTAELLSIDFEQDTAPHEFSAPMTSGKTFHLSDYRGRKVVLYFYPKDNTPGCTTESLHFRDLYPEFRAANAEIFGLSRDNIRSHEGFKAKLDLPFDLISDVDETVCRQFDVLRTKMMYGKKVVGIERSTFAFDAAGRVVKEWRGVGVPEHADEVLAFMKAVD